MDLSIAAEIDRQTASTVLLGQEEIPIGKVCETTAESIGRIAGGVMEIDTWLMSCRVLKRQVESEILNEIVRVARARARAATR